MHPFSTRASVLAIGTELTTGQITNRNAAWLSEQLEALGAEVVLHETVADDRVMILEALERCSKAGAIVFVTGGLGPTSDDFTREVIAQWMGRELKYDEASWRRIEERLTAFGIVVSESNRQQCYFPEGSRILVNEQGTANAFAFARGDNHCWVLPGPPNEIKAVWERDVAAELSRVLPARPARTLLTWQCIGKSEASLGEIVEAALSGSGLSIGYRAHRPFVEIKVWVPGTNPETHREWLDRLDAAIAPWVATRQGEDLAERFLAKLGQGTVRIEDFATGGILSERLSARLRAEGKPPLPLQGRLELQTGWDSPSGSVREALEGAAPTPRNLTIFRVQGLGPEGQWELGMSRGSQIRVEAFQSAFRKKELIDRSRRLVAELVLKTASEWLG